MQGGHSLVAAQQPLAVFTSLPSAHWFAAAPTVVGSVVVGLEVVGSDVAGAGVGAVVGSDVIGAWVAAAGAAASANAIRTKV